MRGLNFFLISIFTTNLLYAQEIELQKGWNLVGLSANTTVEKLKSENSNIKDIFIFKNGFKKSGEINPADGIWIHSSEKFNLNLNYNNLSKDENPSEENRIDKIELTKGWNLISLPINSAISPKLFKDINAIWRFSSGKWSHFGGEDKEYPKVEIIGSGEGFWINSNSDQTIYLSNEESKFTNFNSEDEMNNYLKTIVKYSRSYKNIQSYDYKSDEIPIPEVTATPTVATTTESVLESNIKVEDATTTNTQEAGVDEADIVKHDGEKIFYLPSNWLTTEIYVNTFDRLLEGESEKLTSIKLNSKPNELYLIDNKLIAIYLNDYNNNINSGSRVEVYNVSDLNSIIKIYEYTIDGTILDSRVTNSKLYLVTKFTPYIEVEYPKSYVECKDDTNVITAISPNTVVTLVPDSSIPFPFDIEAKNSYCYYYFKDDNGYYIIDYENPILKTEYLKPTITNVEINNSRVIPTADTLYAPTKFNKSNFITSIISFDIDNFTNQDSISVVGGSSKVYATNSSVYIANDEYPIYFSWSDYKFRTSIYKFSIDDGLNYKGKTFVDGRILNQFSLSEHNDILRVASTTGWSFRSDTNNIISTISENEDGLKILGRLEGLGKEGETIKGVRFLGDRGFVVTFRQTDPFYTIDLSEPTNPKKVGELSINGYSSYFHPIDENRILSIGRDADKSGRTKGVQIELFDISDFANPILADKVTIGEDWRFVSEAENNYKSFTYRSSDNLFSIPISEYYEREPIVIDGENYYPEYRSAYKNYLDIYQIDNLTIKKIDQVDGNATSYYSYNNQRGIIFTKNAKDYALYISGEEVYLKEIVK